VKGSTTCASVLLCSALLAGCTSDGEASEPPPAPAHVAELAEYDADLQRERVESDGRELESAEGAWRVTWLSEPEEVPLNRPFTVLALVRDADGAPREDVDLVVDAGMPHHNHGMNRVPELVPRGGGLFEARGLLFHMPGAWTLTFDVTEDGITERAECVLELAAR
jgi:hypothetical protein